MMRVTTKGARKACLIVNKGRHQEQREPMIGRNKCPRFPPTGDERKANPGECHTAKG